MKEEIQINSLALNISTQCQRKCYHCYSHLDLYDGALMSIDTAKKAAELFFENITEEAGGDFMFFGGEPLMNWPLMKDFIPWFNRQHSRKNVFQFTMTNGILLSPEIIDFHIEHGLRPITVSLNGDYADHAELKRLPEPEFRHILSMIRYCVDIDPDLVVLHGIIRKKNIPRTYEILSFIASQGVRWINLERELYEDWDDADRKSVAAQANRVIRETGVTIQPFLEGIFDCTSCYAPSVMVYPNGDVVDSCYCMASILHDRGLLSSGDLKNLVFGNLDDLRKLTIDIAEKKRMIRKHMDCHLFHENVHRSVDILYDGIPGEKPYFRSMDVTTGKCKKVPARENDR